MTNLTRTSTLVLLLTGAFSLSAQTAPAKSTAPVHHAASATTAHKPVTATAAAGACATNVPVLSPKIPALPAGSACPKPLYTLTTIPAIKLENVAPFESPTLRETLGLDSSSFSLLYVDTKIGAGPLAQPHKWYSIHYTGYLLDGTKFDSSLDRGEPISINYGQHMVIPGWDTGFDGMHIGGKRRLYIPFQLAYGTSAKGPIPARSELIFDVELVSQSDTQPAPKAPAAPPATPKPATDSKPTAEPEQPATPPASTPSTPKQ